MSKKRLDVNWSQDTQSATDFDRSLIRYGNYLKEIGLRESTIESYVGCVGRYLKFAQTDRPSLEDSVKFREILHGRELSRSTINNYSFSIQNYHRMFGESVPVLFLRENEHIPHYFDEDDVLRIFSVCHNIKHLAMLQTLFYGCLRASELCHLDDGDLDLKNLTIRVREGKGGRDGIVLISNECATTLRRYLEVRPPLEINGHNPLFYTDYGKRWDRKDVYRMFIGYKEKAGIEKTGGVHVFARHTPATIMTAKGCDIRIVKEVLRHKDIRTTLRYAHIADRTKRERYEQYLVL